MPYLIADVEATEALPSFRIPEDHAGLAVLIRRRTRPIFFWMEPHVGGSVVSAEELERRILRRAGPKLLREALREEMVSASPAGPLPSLTVAICTRDRPEALGRCLDALTRVLRDGSATAGARPEILVVDNASPNGETRECAAGFPDVRYVLERRPGLDFARNRALREARGELVAFLDDDVVVDRYWLGGLAGAWSENPDAAVFTGLVLPLELESEAQIFFERRGGFRGGPELGFDRRRYGPALPGDERYPCEAGLFGAGANMTVRREVVLGLGGFDEALDTGAPLPAGGDLDLFYRVIRAGYPLVYDPSYLVFHQHRREMKALRRQYHYWGVGFMAFLDKSYGTDPAMRPRLRRQRLWWFEGQLRQLVKALRIGSWIRFRMILTEMAGGLRGLLGAYARSGRRVERIRRRFA